METETVKTDNPADDMRSTRRDAVSRWLQRAGLALWLLLLLAPLKAAGLERGDAVQQLALPYQFRLVDWEVLNLPTKWGYMVLRALPFSEHPPGPEVVNSYFHLGEAISQAQRATIAGGEPSARLAQQLKLAELQKEQVTIRDEVEYVLEHQTQIVTLEQGLGWRLGSLTMSFPPVDFRLESTPYVLIISPRDKIETQRTVLLRTQIDLAGMEKMEAQASALNLSGLVEETGGVATYPSIVSSTDSLKDTLTTAAHEWLHQYFFFHPLGRRYFASPEMTSINETAADLAGGEIGDLVYQRYYAQGSRVSTSGTPRLASVAGGPGTTSQREGFDFNKEMRATRLMVDDLLAAGRIEEAEQYMEQRREFLAEHGYFIRKINQAYFAFHGTYGESPSAVSPIGRQVRKLREMSPSLGQFIKTIAQVSSYEDLKALIGARP